MFTIPSLQKLLVLGLVLAAVWYGFKIAGRIKESRDKSQSGQGGTARSGTTRRSATPQAREETIEAEETVVCSACGAYVAAKAANNCGKPDCPY